MQSAQAAMLPDGRRLHLHHGPIDLIIEAWGRNKQAAYEQATARFKNLLQELVDELPVLRSPMEPDRIFKGPIARRMQDAISPYQEVFVTPMAAVAGAVADEVLTVMKEGNALDKAYVNNGGDSAFHVSGSQKIEATIAASTAGKIVIDSGDPFRGVATSGWSGRSHSLGIADNVSVVAKNAAAADVAATLIANAVDIPGHKAIDRATAISLAPDSDLGEKLVTTDVGELSPLEIDGALINGAEFADDLRQQDLIGGALLVLKDQVRHVGALPKLEQASR